MRESLHESVPAEVLPGLGTTCHKMGMEGPEEFLDLCEVILALAPLLRLLGLEEEVTGQQLVHHAPQRPNISGLGVGLPQDHLRRAVLPGLDLGREVVVFPAGVAKVGDLDTQGQLQILGATHVEPVFPKPKDFLDGFGYLSGGALHITDVMTLKFLLP